MRDKENLRGYMSVEASLVFPIVLGILIFLILFILYLHGRVIADSVAYGSAIRASSLKENEWNDFRSGYKGWIHSRNEMTGHIAGGMDIREEKGEIYVDITTSMGFYVPFIPLRDELKTRNRVRAVQVDEVKIIRNTRMAEDMIELIREGGEEEKDEE